MDLSTELKYFSFILLLCILWILNTKENEFVKFKQFIQKFKLFLYSISFMVYSKDNKGLGPKYNPDPDLIKDHSLDSKTIIFIRHGESDWNNVFNKGINVSFIWRLLSSLFDEFLLSFKLDSKFLDSPLNQDGIEQAEELSRFLESNSHPEANERIKKLLEIMKADNGSSVIVSSSLRRAISTTTVALWKRIERTHEKIIILSSLQEISRNIDTQSLSKPHQIADLPFSRITKFCNINGAFDPSDVYDLSENFGNKTRNFYGIKRLQAFSKWVFMRNESTIIVGGHSLWFKNFFLTYLPHKSTHEAKQKKMTNSGVVAFTLHRSEDDKGISQYRIDPDSITVLYGGFTTK